MNFETHSDVIVIGGGISGLATAWTLRNAGADMMLLESKNEVGGCMRSELRDGVILEKGPFNVLVRDESFHDLLDASGNEVEAISASLESKARFVLKDGELQAVPAGPGPLLKTKLLSTAGKLRLMRGMLASRPGAPDATIAEAAARRFGPEVADTFISSIVAGVFGGDSAKLSLDACFPSAGAIDRTARSPLFPAISAARPKKKTGGPERPKRGLVSFRDGLQSLPNWLADQLGDNILRGCTVNKIWREGENYALCTEMGGVQQLRTARQIVLATPVDVASDLLTGISPVAADQLKQVHSSSLVVANLGYRATDVEHPMSGYGFLVPASEPVPIMGVLWADSAFPHHAPSGQRLVRVFMGGPRDLKATTRSDDEIVRIAHDAIQPLLGLGDEPNLVDICRWPNAIPQYEIGHVDRADRVEAHVAECRGLHLAGNYLRGVSINDCVSNGVKVAEAVLEQQPVRSLPNIYRQLQGVGHV